MAAVGKLLTSRAYWLTLALFSGSMVAVALYYQYVLGEEPCQACIQVRLWVVGLLILGSSWLACLQKHPFSLQLTPGGGFCSGSGGALLVSVSVGERQGRRQLRIQLGMPDWFAVDRWFPSLFEVRNLCSFTPDMLFGLSMAEALLLTAAGLIVGILCSIIATFSPQAFPHAGVSGQPKAPRGWGPPTESTTGALHVAALAPLVRPLGRRHSGLSAYRTATRSAPATPLQNGGAHPRARWPYCHSNDSRSQTGRSQR